MLVLHSRTCDRRKDVLGTTRRGISRFFSAFWKRYPLPSHPQRRRPIIGICKTCPRATCSFCAELATGARSPICPSWSSKRLPISWWRRADALLRSGNIRDALAAYKRVQGAGFDNYALRVGLGQCPKRLGVGRMPLRNLKRHCELGRTLSISQIVPGPAIATRIVNW